MKKYLLISLLYFSILPLLGVAEVEYSKLKEAQIMLQDMGFNPFFIDGIMGAKTAAAIEKYQASRDLEVTGTLNEATWRSLMEKNPVAQAEQEEAVRVQPVVSTMIDPTTTIKPILTEPTTIENTKSVNTGLSRQMSGSLKGIIMDPVKYISQPGDKKLRIGVNTPLGPERAFKKWHRIADYLSANIKGYHFEFVPKRINELYEMIDELDYLLSQPQMFVDFEYTHKFRAVVTLRNLRLGKALDVFGAIIFTRSDSDINDMADLKGKSIGSLGEKTAWGGWALGWHTLLKYDVDPYTDMTIKSYKIQPQVVFAVLKGEVDSGSVRSDVLERMAKAKKINLDDFKLVYDNPKYHDTYPFLLSSDLYPEWIFSASLDTNEEINRRIAALLLILNKDSIISKSAKIDGWTIPSNYQGVKKVLQDLKVSPYESYGEFSLHDVLIKYWPIIAMAIISLLILAISAIYFRKLSAKVSKTNENLMAVQTKLVQSEKMAGIGTMVAGITHELNTPLAFATSNIALIKDETEENIALFKDFSAKVKNLDYQQDEDLVDLIEEVDEILADEGINEMIGYVVKGLDGVSKLVLSLKNYSRIDRSQSDIVDFHEGLESTLLIANNAIKQIATVETDYGELPNIECSPSQINQVVMNILMNGVHAIEEKAKKLGLDSVDSYPGKIIVKTWAKKNHVFLSISDNGNGMTAATKKKIFEPMFTTKEVGKGMGMGLSLTSQIIKNHGGTIKVKSKQGDGCTFIIKLPVRQAKKEEDNEISIID